MKGEIMKNVIQIPSLLIDPETVSYTLKSIEELETFRCLDGHEISYIAVQPDGSVKLRTSLLECIEREESTCRYRNAGQLDVMLNHTDHTKRGFLPK